MAETFPLFDLPIELQFEVVNSRTLDPPSFFACALVSRTFRELFLRYHGPNYNAWRFLDEAARLGHVALLKEAFGRGARLDYRMLELAVQNNHSELARWLRPLVAADIDASEEITLCRLACASGNPDLLKIFWVKQMNYYLDFLAEGAKSGHTAFVNDMLKLIKQHNPKFAPTRRLCYYAACGGHKRAALDLCALPQSPTAEELRDIAEGACENRARDLLDYCLARDAFPSLATLCGVVPFGDFSFFSYAMEKLAEPLTLAHYLRLQTSACFAPNAVVFHYLFTRELAKEAPFNDTHLRLLFLRGYTDAPRFLAFATQSEETAKGRFEAIKYLAEHGKENWPADLVLNVPFWAQSAEQMAFIFGRITGPRNFALYLERYLVSHSIADVVIVEYLLSNGAQLSLEVFIEIAFLENNIQIIDFIVQRMGKHGFARCAAISLLSLSVWPPSS